ncbi:MAG: glycine zipper domain-containing protein [Limisphaerales bacterium]
MPGRVIEGGLLNKRSGRTATTSGSQTTTNRDAAGVREHPYQAVGIAFAVGLLIGVLVARSRRG